MSSNEAQFHHSDAINDAYSDVSATGYENAHLYTDGLSMSDLNHIETRAAKQPAQYEGSSALANTHPSRTCSIRRRQGIYRCHRCVVDRSRLHRSLQHSEQLHRSWPANLEQLCRNEHAASATASTFNQLPSNSLSSRDLTASASNNGPTMDEIVPTNFDEGVLRSLCDIDCGMPLLFDRIKQSMVSAREASVFLKKRAAIEEEYARSMVKLSRSTFETYSLSDAKAAPS